jgi:hypothetical protein
MRGWMTTNDAMGDPVVGVTNGMPESTSNIARTNSMQQSAHLIVCCHCGQTLMQSYNPGPKSVRIVKGCDQCRASDSPAAAESVADAG